MSREARKASTKRSADLPTLGKSASQIKPNQQLIPGQTLNVTTSLVSQWERGEKRPRGASLKLLTLVAKNGLGAVA